MQSCCFWGSGNAIYDLWIDENPDYFSHLLVIQEQNEGENGLSALDKGIQFLSVVIQLNSGDELRITCKSIELSEKMLAYPTVDIIEPQVT